ncbi:MAG: alpha/beta hydrolase [Planctomycetaceae bacterium]|nr:alpha/beta hydrolase [Planctomycetaceae bacterium]
MPLPAVANDPAQARAAGVGGWRKLKRPLAKLAACYAAVCLLMMALETRLVYQPPASDVALAFHPKNQDVEEVRFESADGTRLHGVLCLHPGSKRVVLYCHGNGENVRTAFSRMQQLSESLDANVMVFDFRGYGESEGSPYEEGVIADGLAAQRWLAERMDCQPDDIVVLGRSLGGGIATAIAAQQGARGLVLQNTFHRLDEVAAGKYFWLPVRWLIRNHYHSDQWIAQFRGPVLQSHGTADRIVPYESGQELFAACPSADKRFFAIDGGRHNQIEPPAYDAVLQAWFERVFASP